MSQHYYLHIGSGKSGTSTIQAFLNSNREALSRHGVYYPKTKRVLHASLICDNYLRPIGMRQQAREWGKLIKEAKKTQCGKVVVSCEMLALHAQEEDIRQIKNLLVGHKVTIIYYVRRHDSLLQSIYLQGLKMGRHLETPEDYLEGFQRNYLRIVNLWAGVFGDENVTIFPYEKSSLKPSLLHTFFDCINEPYLSEYTSVERCNESPCRDAVAAMIAVTYLAKRGGIDRESLKFVNRAFGKTQQLVSGEKRHFNIFGPEQKRMVVEQNLPQYEEIARRFLGREDGILFREPISSEESSMSDSLGLNRESVFSLFVATQVMQRRRLMSVPRWLIAYYTKKIIQKVFRCVGLSKEFEGLNIR